MATVDFDIEKLNECIICPLCKGYFREAVTIDECLHTCKRVPTCCVPSCRSFNAHCSRRSPHATRSPVVCKTCLDDYLDIHSSKCLLCDVEVKRKHIKPDRLIQQLVDAVFPNYKIADAKALRKICEERDVAVPLYVDDILAKHAKSLALKAKKERKKENAKLRASSDNNGKRNKSDAERQRKKKKAKLQGEGEQVMFHCQPYKDGSDADLPELKNPRLRTTDAIAVQQVKKFILKRLERPDLEVKNIEVLCDGVVIGTEHTISYVRKSIAPGVDPLVFHYRLAKPKV